MADLDGPSPRPTPDNLTQHVHGTFQRAVNRCINSFSPELRTEIRRFNSARGILEHMRGLEQNVGLGIPRNIEAFCNAVSRLSDVLDPYSACITSFMQVKPEICGLVWGTVQFIFKACIANLEYCTCPCSDQLTGFSYARITPRS